VLSTERNREKWENRKGKMGEICGGRNMQRERNICREK